MLLWWFFYVIYLQSSDDFKNATLINEYFLQQSQCPPQHNS